MRYCKLTAVCTFTKPEQENIFLKMFLSGVNIFQSYFGVFSLLTILYIYAFNFSKDTVIIFLCFFSLLGLNWTPDISENSYNREIHPTLKRDETSENASYLPTFPSLEDCLMFAL